MGLREVKSELNKLKKGDLINQIAELYKKYMPVKEYFDFYVNPDEDKLLEQYKERVTSGFFPKHGYKLKVSISRKAINDFKKLGTSQESLADLLLHYVECGVEFTNAYGDIGENFYTSVENAYDNALEVISKNGMLKKFKSRATAIVKNTEGIGWGVHDSLGDVFCEHYE